MREINIAISADDNYAKYMGVVIASCLKNASLNDNLHFYLLDGGISNENKEKINSLKTIKDCEIDFIKINENDFDDYKKIKTHSYISLAACYRLKLASLLPNVEKIIYLDCDTVVNSSLKDLFNTNLKGHPIAGALDINKRMLKKNPTYINSGVLVMDLKAFREDKLEEKLLNWTKENIDKIKTGDQEIINEVFKDNIQIVNEKWNVQSSNFTNRSSYTKYPHIVHFVAKKKPWHFTSYSFHKKLYFKYLQLTPWKLNEEELNYWTKTNQIASLISYFKYRPLFALRPRLYEAMFKTYVLPLFQKRPIIKNNTFLLWEPCSKSHSEVLPGYAKYLLDLRYHVSVLAQKERFSEGLFSKFKHKNLSLNKISRNDIKKYLLREEFADVEGILITTAGKLCDSVDYNQIYEKFNSNTPKNKIHIVEHEVCHSVDKGTWNDKIITLRELDYKGAKSTVVNPHYFGEVAITPKNEKITNFITIGAIQGKKKNNDLIINSALELVENGYTNFKITVVGKGNLKGLPQKLHPYFDIKGRLPFKKMYEEIEKADFILTSYNENDPKHIRYNTSGTSGNFQLVYGFLKPVVIIESFTKINGFDKNNSLVYQKDKDYAKTLKQGIEMSIDDYKIMQNNLKIYQEKLFNSSLNNLKGLINE